MYKPPYNNKGPKKGKNKPNKPQNAFYYFMIDFRKKEEAKGIFYDSTRLVAEAAGVIWSSLGEAEKRPFELKAQEMRKKNSEVKYTSLGEPIPSVINRELSNIDKMQEMENYIEKLVNSNFNNGGFADLVFYVCHVNYYCESTVDGRFYPAEIGVARFNLRNGVDTSDVFHVIFNTGEIVNGEPRNNLPIGYRLAAEAHAEQSHDIPPPPHPQDLGSRSDMKGSYAFLLNFLKSSNPGYTNNLGDNEYPPLYVDQFTDKIAENVFNWTMEQLGLDADKIKIYSLPFLFFCLRNAASMKKRNEPAYVAKSIALNELEKDSFEFAKGICCPYHETTEKFNFCSLSKAARSAFFICDNCCRDLEIPLVPGRHVPNEANPLYAQKRAASRATSTLTDTRPQSVMSNYSEASTRTQQSTQAPSEATVTSCDTRPPLTTSRCLAEAMEKKCNMGAWNGPNPMINNGPSFNDFPSLGGGRSIRSPSANVGAWAGNNSGTRPGFGRGRGRIPPGNRTGAVPKKRDDKPEERN